MSENFLIYIDRLKSGSEEHIEQTVDSKWIEVEENELQFVGDISFEGKAYLTQEHLILHLDIEAKAQMPCKMCNEAKPVEVKLEGFYHTEPVEKIKDGIFDMQNVVRDAILLEIPSYYECRQTDCEGRLEAEKYLKTSEQSGDENLPFANL